MADQYTDEDLLALSGIQHYAFCERQWGLIHLEQQWQENLKTAEGHILHEHVHDPDYKESRVGVVSARSLPLKSYSLGLAGVADLVEFVPLSDENDSAGVLLSGRKGRYQPVPVEYKRGKPKKDDRDAVQLCAQAICLEEMMSVQIEYGYLFYGQTQHRLEVVFNHTLRQRVESLVKNMHDSYEAGNTPVARKGVKCSLCSMENICLPKMMRKTRSVEAYLSEMLGEVDLEVEV
ncbi:MAG: CRISPR-associated protein Cas4 [Syntrophomonas sp.]